jgi:alcohol dehydrogenase (cytochrome c)
MRIWLGLVCLGLWGAALWAQGGGVTPQELLKPLKEQWPTYNGDYSGRRYSLLKEVNTATVKNLSLAWMIRLTPGMPQAGGGGGRGRFAPPSTAKRIVGGEGTG